MKRPLVVLVTETEVGRSKYQAAVRNCCKRGGYELRTAPNEGNKDPIVRIVRDNQVVKEARGFSEAAKMLVEQRTSHPKIIEDVMKHLRFLRDDSPVRLPEPAPVGAT